MKKTLVALLALLLMAVLGLVAQAETMYVNKNRAKVYTERSKDSEVVCPLPEGGPVEAQKTKDGWTFISFLDRRGVGRSGWIQSKYLDSKPIHNHTWSDWKVTRKATCEHTGTKERTCTTCGKTQSKEIEKKEHDWGKWKVTKQATCAQEGTRTRTCAVCGKKQTKNYLEDHTYGSWSMTVEPTCTQKGERVRTCAVCGKRDVQALNTLPHDFAWQVTLEPTDHSAGTRTKICVNCGLNGGEESFDPEGTLRRKDRGEDVYNMQQLLVEQGYLNAGGADGIFGGGTEKALIQYQQDRGLTADGVAWPQTLEDLQHDFGPWETVREMTRTQAGERVRVCRGCGFEQHETVEPGNVLERGARGENVRAMQQMLTQMGFNAGGFDGIYGKKLDAALASFAAANNFTVQEGVIRPGDVDEVFNVWVGTVSDAHWKGEGDVNTPVNLALTVTEAGETDDSGITAYTWSLTNLGSENATFVTLLLAFGDDPDFKTDNLVMYLDGFDLKKNSGNSASGSFSVDEDWGDGRLNFAALAMNEKSGDVWLSNAVAFEDSKTPQPRTIYPMAGSVDVNNLVDGGYSVSFDQGDVASVTSGVYFNAVHIYTLDAYSHEDIAALKVGDTIVVSGQDVPVMSLERVDGEVVVNGGLDAQGFELWDSPNYDGYVVHLESDMATFTEHGVTTLMLDPTATFTDAWDIDAGPVTLGYDAIADAVRTSENPYFVPYNTTLTLQGGRIVALNRVYVS